MTHQSPDRSVDLVVITAGTGTPSTTSMLAQNVAAATVAELAAQHITGQITPIEVRPLATDIATALTTGNLSTSLTEVSRSIANADGLIVATPVYQATASGMLVSLLNVLDNEIFIDLPVALAATAGTQRHSLVPDQALRPLFGYLRTLITPSTLFAAPEDWGGSSLDTHVRRVAIELAAFVSHDLKAELRERTWHRHRHEFPTDIDASTGASAADETPEVDLNTDLMRLATGEGQD